MTEEKRIINWNTGMQNDFHYLAIDSENGACLLYNFMSVDEDDYPSLGDCFDPLSDEDKTQFAQDLIDLYTGKAEFPEQLYYVKLPKLDYSYLIQREDEGFDLCSIKHNSYKNKFTMSEIKAIDPRYEAFAIKVEDK